MIRDQERQRCHEDAEYHGQRVYTSGAPVKNGLPGTVSGSYHEPMAREKTGDDTTAEEGTIHMLFRLRPSEHALIVQAAALAGVRWPVTWARGVLLAAASKTTTKRGRRAKAA
jgi:hypothetical protein